MPVTKLSFRSGINKESTSYANEGGYFDGTWVRFRSGYAEKIGGWQNLSFTNTFKGVARSLWSWINYSSQKLLGIGTSQKYYIEYGSQYYDITPVRATSGNLTNPLTTTLGSRLVTVTHAAHEAAAGTFVRIESTVAVGGLTISGEYEIISVPTGNTFTIAASSPAISSATGGGIVTLSYDVNAGSSTYTVVYGGWGAGGWGNSGWGEAAGIAIATNLRLWSQCNYGEDLIMAPRGGTLYYWDATAFDPNNYTRAVTIASKANLLGKVEVIGLSFAAGAASLTIADPTGITAGSYITGTGIAAGTYVTNAYDYGTTVPISTPTTGSSAGDYTFSYAGQFVPYRTEAVFSAEISKFIVCLGANPYNPNEPVTPYDPMLVRWSDQDNCYEWTPSVTNQSGEFHLNIGSYLVCAMNARQEILVWTDAALYSMQYLGPPYVFGFNLLADNISIISPNAAVSTNNTNFWMGVDKFYVYTGRVETLPCTVWHHVFSNINRDQAFQIVSGSNEGYNEVWWFYPSANSSVNDRYVIFNYAENVWYCGEISRTAWLDSPLRSSPMAAFSAQDSQLSASILSTDTEIGIRSVESYPVSGTVIIEGEEIAYTSRSSDRLLGCTRGVNNTTAAAHDMYTAVRYKIPNQIMYHEVGVDDNSFSEVAPIYAYIASADFDIGDGHDFGFVWRILPDLTFNGSTSDNPKVTLMLKARSNSGTPYISSSSPPVMLEELSPLEKFTGYPVTPLNAGQVYTRVRGRQMQFRLESSEVGVTWQWGQMRIDIRPDGRRA